MLLPPQSRTPWQLNPLPDKAALNEAFVGMPLSELRTPALIIDRSVFKAVSQEKEGGGGARRVWTMGKVLTLLLPLI
jgi:hypothetical protein